MENQYLLNISVVDGRYKDKTEEMNQYFSEFAFIRYRVLVEVEYLLALSKIDVIDKLTDDETQYLKNIYKNFSLDDAVKVKEFEKETNHDVKSIEYYLKEKIDEMKSLEEKGVSIFVHFCLTSQDVNSVANIIMLKNAVQKVLLPKINNILLQLKEMIKNWSKEPMLSHTHGQPASPTFVGKELLVFYERLVKQARTLNEIKYSTKFGGAVGNFNAHHFSLPHVDWIDFADKFVNLLGLERNQYTTQVDHYDNYSVIFDNIKRINCIFIDMCQDMWLYISKNVFMKKNNDNTVGSSTMPHKINPILWENSEINLKFTNNNLFFLSSQLPVSRLQRDLKDSSLLRNIGYILSLSLLSYININKALSDLTINKHSIHYQLTINTPILSEPIQSRLKILGFHNSYQQLHHLFLNTLQQQTNQNNNNNINPQQSLSILFQQNLNQFINDLDIDENEKKYLKTVTPHNYTGIYKL